MLSILIEFIPNRSEHVVADGCRSKPVKVVSLLPQGSVLGHLLLLMHTSELFSMLEDKIIYFADDSTLIALCPPRS